MNRPVRESAGINSLYGIMESYEFDLDFSFEHYYESDDIRKAIRDKSWRLVSTSDNKKSYIFRRDNIRGKTGSVVISEDGIISYANYAYVQENRSIIVENGKERFMMKPIFLGNPILILQIEGQQGYTFLIDEEQQDKFISNDIKDIQTTLNSILKVELEAKARKLKSKLSYWTPAVLFCSAITFLMVLGITSGVTNTKLGEMKITVFLICLWIAILIAGFVYSLFKRGDRKSILYWKEKNPNSPLNEFL